MERTPDAPAFLVWEQVGNITHERSETLSSLDLLTHFPWLTEVLQWQPPTVSVLPTLVLLLLATQRRHLVILQRFDLGPLTLKRLRLPRRSLVPPLPLRYYRLSHWHPSLGETTETLSEAALADLLPLTMLQSDEALEDVLVQTDSWTTRITLLGS